MEEKLLPKVQIALAILFGLVVLLAPLFIRSFETMLFLAAAAGLALGGVTVVIGWMVIWQGRNAVYPFLDWSLSLLKRVYGAKVVLDLEKKKRQPSASRQKWLGIANLVVGGLVSAAGLWILLYALSQGG